MSLEELCDKEEEKGLRRLMMKRLTDFDVFYIVMKASIF